MAVVTVQVGGHRDSTRHGDGRRVRETLAAELSAQDPDAAQTGLTLQFRCANMLGDACG